MSNIIKFPATRITTASRIESSLRAMREACDAEMQHKGQAALNGILPGDRVRHLSYGWNGVVAPFDWLGDDVPCAVPVYYAFDGMRSKIIRVEAGKLQKLYAHIERK